MVLFGTWSHALGRESAFHHNDAPLAGTDGRTEVEFKLAFAIDDAVALDDVSGIVHRALIDIGKKKEFSFEKIMGRKYRLDNSFQAFLFRDIYLDTPDLHVLASGSAYRVRHRWRRYELYLHHRLLPFMRSFFPNRCEIQFKTGYQPDFERQVVTPRETRFEFRNESPPFDIHQDAPESPWPLDEFIKYAQTGRYKSYKIKPMAELLEVLGHSEDAMPDLQPMVEVLTVRDRIHLNMKHPWGSGPNPEQTFIITLDKTTLGHTYGRDDPGINVLEIEIEIERNASTEIEKLIELGNDDDVRFAEVKNAAVRHSEDAWQALVEDLDLLKDAIHEVSTKIKGRPLPLNYKYARIMEMINAGQQTAKSLPAPSAARQ